MILSFKNTESEEAKDVLMNMAKQLSLKKQHSLKELSKTMTRERALRIKILRKNCSYGALANKVAQEWNDEDVFWRDLPSSQIVGSVLCDVAMEVLGEDLEEFESLIRWWVRADHSILKRIDESFYDEEERDKYIKELEELNYENITIEEERNL